MAEEACQPQSPSRSVPYRVFVSILIQIRVTNTQITFCNFYWGFKYFVNVNILLRQLKRLFISEHYCSVTRIIKTSLTFYVS